MTDISIKICIWMNMPSHHQSAFFEALLNHENIDLQVRYYEQIPDQRKKLGWQDKALTSYEQYVYNPSFSLTDIGDWKERIHVVPGFSSTFLKELLPLIIENNVQWIHWSERSGIGLAQLLHFNYYLIKLLTPLFLYLKGYKKYAKLINENSLGAFAIGELAKQDFLQWGIDNLKIKFMPYSLEGLAVPKKKSLKLRELDEVLYMYIGSLDERKGIDVLLKSFQKLVQNSNKCKLVLVGEDRSNGKYKKLAKKLDILNNVNFVGSIDSDKVNEYLIQADVFVLPTRFDGWGAVLNEAASMGKPLVSTDQAGASYHLIKSGENGFIVKAGDIGELFKAISFYMNYPEQITAHGNKSFEISKNFTPERSACLFVDNIKYFLEQEQ